MTRSSQAWLHVAALLTSSPLGGGAKALTKQPLLSESKEAGGAGWRALDSLLGTTPSEGQLTAFKPSNAFCLLAAAADAAGAFSCCDGIAAF